MEIEKEKVSRAAWSAGAIVVLVAALGLGFGIRKIRTWRAEVNRRASAQTQTKPATAKNVGVEPIKELAEIAEEEAVVSAAEPNEPVVVEAEQAAKEDSNDAPGSEPMQEPGMMGQGIGRWQQMWADLNLTPEEQARLREGFALAMDRWRNMPEEQRQAEMARFRGMREQWEGMSDEEREGAMQRMRDRFEDWRASGAVELPEMTLD
ncbi:MAG TPA: hypothetical protein VJJ98_02030 [Sedimentisphaerales bacterium]|nr:hypothetical protein [Sedimentisphaerales bacterium]